MYATLNLIAVAVGLNAKAPACVAFAPKSKKQSLM